MDAVSLALANLSSPPILCFALGALAVAIRSDLRLPDGLFTMLSFYLLFAIGLQGGVKLREAGLVALIGPVGAALALGVTIPFATYALARGPGRMTVSDAAALAAHYGSVSAVTFAATTAYLDLAGIPYDGYVAALLAVMEAPGIIVAIALAKRAGIAAGSVGAPEHGAARPPEQHWLHELAAGRSVLLLVGGLAIGAIAGPSGYQPVKPLFGDLFRGLLCLFLLDLGMTVASRVRDVGRSGLFLVVHGVAMPVCAAVAGLLLAWAAGMAAGSAIVLATLAASASYIAAPAAVRSALPTANPGLALTASLVITFPFNLVVGIPLYRAMADRLYGP